jgi:predicted GNAT family acetyltransferase
MLRVSSPVRPLGLSDSQRALAICARDPVTNVFVAARVLEGGLSGSRGALFGYQRADEQGLCWASANVVPVECTPAMVDAFAERVVKRRRWASSLFGPMGPVLQLWAALEPAWGTPREVRESQPVLTVREGPGRRGVRADPAVRPATEDETDLVVPAAAAMFTEEIGYPPYQGSDAAYRAGVASLIRMRRTLIRTEGGEVVFKADLGSVALGVAQVQGVWVHPDWRGRGLAVPAMAAVVDHTLRQIAPTITLYVNDFNTAALATYGHVGFVQTGSFATVLL